MGILPLLTSVNDNPSSWIENVDWVRLTRLVALALLILLALILVISSIVFRNRNYLFEKRLKSENNTIRIYKIDEGKDTLVQFDVANVAKKKTMPLQDFYGSFPIGEQAKVKEWLNGIFDGKAVDQYIETDIYFSSSKKIVKSFLFLTKSDPSNGMVYLESHPLPPIPKTVGKDSPKTSEDTFATRLKDSGGNKGYTFCFTVFPVGNSNKATGNDKKNIRDMPKGSSARYFSVISTFARSDQLVIQASNNEIIIASFAINDITQALSFALRTANGAKELMNKARRRNEPLYDVKCGMVHNRLFPLDADAILTETRNTALDAFEGKTTLIEYKKGQFHISEKTLEKSKNEVERILSEKKISYKYRPIYSLEKHRVVAYLADATPINSSFTTMNELKNYAIRAKDEKNLFAALGKNLVPRFIQERPLKSQKLFYPVRVNEMHLVPAFFSKLKNSKDAHLVFIFTDSDIVNSLTTITLDELIAGFHAIRLAGFDVGVSVSGNSLVLQAPILRQMSAFLVDFSSSDSDEQLDTRIRSQLHSLVEKLLKYKKPIIASSLKNWNSLELVVGSGITYISSDVFAPFNEMLVPVNEKNEKRLLSIFK